MIIRTTKDIPAEVKNVVELFYIQDADVAQAEAIRLGIRKPELKPLLDHVMTIFPHAPESVFSFYDELIARNGAFNAGGEFDEDDALDINLGDSLSGLMDDDIVSKARPSRWTMNGNKKGSDMRTPVPTAMSPNADAPKSTDNDAFEIDIDFDMEGSGQNEKAPARKPSFSLHEDSARPAISTISASPLDEAEISDDLFDFSSMLNDGSSLEVPNSDSLSALKSTEMPMIDLSSMLGNNKSDGSKLKTVIPTARNSITLQPSSIQQTKEIAIVNEMTKSPFDGHNNKSKSPAFNSSELKRLRSNLTAGSADIMRAASNNAFKSDIGTRHLVSEAAPGIPSISPLGLGEGRRDSSSLSSLGSKSEKALLRPTALNLTPVSGNISVKDEKKTVVSAPPIAPISLNSVSPKPAMPVDIRKTSVQLSPISSTSGSGHKFSSIPDETPKPAAMLSPISILSQKAPVQSEPSEAKQTVIAMSPIAITPRKKLDPTAEKLALERIQPITRTPCLKCRLAEISQRKDINPRAGFILSMIDGFTTISDILDISAWPEPETAQLLLELEQQGIVSFM